MSAAVIPHVRALGDDLFGKRMGLMSFWQEIAEQFYGQRASFTTVNDLGPDTGSNTMTSAPALAHRDLSNAFSSMLRPSAKEWFKIRSKRPDKESTEDKQYLEWLTKLQKNAMYDRVSGFVRATKEADADFAAFGQCVIQCELYRPGDGGTPHLLHRCHHLRDVAWTENAIGQVTTVFRKWEPTALDLKRYFPNKLHDQVAKKLEKLETAYERVNVWHVVMPRELYETYPGGRKYRTPFVSMFIDIDNMHEMECVGQHLNGYVIPRWQTVSGSQYAHSPATFIGLADARLLQAVTLVLLEAGEKAVNPPLIVVGDAVRSDIDIRAGGKTWVDADYDERLGAVLRPIAGDAKGLGFGLDLLQDIRIQLKEAFFLNKLNMPQNGPEMTAYEVGQRIQEYIRNALPLFEPMETDYNGQLCEVDLKLLMRGDPTIGARAPDTMRGQDVEFVFESPLREAIEKQKMGQFLEAGQVIASAMQLDQSAIYEIDAIKATRDVLGAVMPASWSRTEGEADAMRKNAAMQRQQQELMAMMAQGSEVAKTTSEAAANAADTLGIAA